MSFDHTLRDRDLVVEHYLSRQLSEEEAAAFEEHYLECPDCLDQLETARALRRGLATVVAEDAARPAPRSRSWLLAAALFLAALVPAGWWGHTSLRLERDLAVATATHADRVAGLERDLENRASEVLRVTEERAALLGELAREREPQTNAPYLPLSALRSGPPSAPTVRVTRPTGAGRIVVGLAVGPDELGPFVAALRSGERELWRGRGLHPDTLGEVRISFHAEMLPPGDYVVELEGAGRVGRLYVFRVDATESAPR